MFIRIRWRWSLILGAAAILLTGGLMTLISPGSASRLLGTGGFIVRTVDSGPHPFVFERPRFWDDATQETQRASGGTLIIGPASDEGVLMTSIGTGMSRVGDRWPAGPLTSLDDFIDRFLSSSLSSRRDLSRDVKSLAGGRPARDLTYEYTSCEPWSANPRCIRVRTRAVFFEDRGYYYVLFYRVRDAEYEQYLDVFERMLSSFHFLD